MKQAYKVISLVAIGGLAFVVIYAIARILGIKRDEKSGVIPTVYPDEPLPDVPKTDTEKAPINSDSGIVLNRAKQLYSNAQSRNAVISKYGVTVPTPGTTEFPAAVREVLTRSGANEIPIIPSFISSTYEGEINKFLQTRNFEELAKSAGFEQAKQIYRESMTFPAANLSLFNALFDVVNSDGFGRVQAAGDHARRRYWDIEKATNVFKGLFTQAKKGSKELSEALKEQAIEDLRNAGYKVIGYDQ